MGICGLEQQLTLGAGGKEIEVHIGAGPPPAGQQHRLMDVLCLVPAQQEEVDRAGAVRAPQPQQGDVCLEAGGPQPMGGGHLLPELLALVFVDVRKDNESLGMGRLDAARQIQGVLVELGKYIQLRAAAEGIAPQGGQILEKGQHHTEGQQRAHQIHHNGGAEIEVAPHRRPAHGELVDRIQLTVQHEHPQGVVYGSQQRLQPRQMLSGVGGGVHGQVQQNAAGEKADQQHLQGLVAAGGTEPAVQGAQQQPQRRQQQRQNAAQENLWHGRQLLSDQINIRGPYP